MKFSVCIPCTRPDTLAHAIAAIQRQTLTDWELIVVAQGTRAAEIEQVIVDTAAGDPRIRCVHNNGRGACVARNAGIQASKGEILAFTDDDCEAHPEWLALIAERFARYPEVGVVGGALVAPPAERPGVSICPEIHPPEMLYDPVASGSKAPADWGWVTANVAIKRSIFERHGFFDPYLGPGTEFSASEESDYILRLERAGISMASTPAAIVYHSYGRRYGVREVYKLARNYAVGSGGCAAKLTLLGDRRGEEWRRDNWQDTLELLRLGRIPAFLRRALRYWYFSRAYSYCLRAYGVDPETQLLTRSRRDRERNRESHGVAAQDPSLHSG